MAARLSGSPGSAEAFRLLGSVGGIKVGIGFVLAGVGQAGSFGWRGLVENEVFTGLLDGGGGIELAPKELPSWFAGAGLASGLVIGDELLSGFWLLLSIGRI